MARLPSPLPEREILPSAHLSPGERLDLYSNMYFARLHDALAEDYPAVRLRIGEARFEALARAYFRRFPSRHPSLNFLGRQFPHFLTIVTRLLERDLLASLAKTENAMSEVFDEAETEVLDEKDFRALPATAWGRVRLRTNPALRLLALDHAVNLAINASREGKRISRVAKNKSWLVVYRKNDRVWRMELTRPQFEALSTLQRGATLARAVSRFANFSRANEAVMAEQIHRSFLEWAREGFFVSIMMKSTRKDKRT